ncbi:MAG: helix-turn-helix domain-containing protein [archaeon]
MIEEIKKLGLNEYEAKVYRSLLSMGKSSAVALSRSASVPRARVYDVLSTLEKKGFVVKSVSKPIEFVAVSPSKVFEGLARSRNERLVKELKELEGVAFSLENSSKESDFGSEQAWVVDGRHNIYSLISQELEKCVESVLISAPDSSIKRKKASFSNYFDALGAKGVKVIANRRQPGARFMVFDKNSVLLFMTPEKQDEAHERALFINSPFLAEYFYSNGKK